MKKSHLLKAGVLALLASTSSALADGASKTPVYTSYDDIPAVRPYVVPPTVVVTRARDTNIVVVPAIAYQNCCCCCGNVALAMSVAAGGMVVSN